MEQSGYSAGAKTFIIKNCLKANNARQKTKGSNVFYLGSYNNKIKLNNNTIIIKNIYEFYLYHIKKLYFNDDMILINDEVAIKLS